MRYKSLHGPASINRSLCNNSSDFITMEELNEINFHNFISYKDDDGFIYGFNICSLYNLFIKDKIPKNPYNRREFSCELFKSIKSLLRKSNLLGIKINIELEDDNKNPLISPGKLIELKALSLFQKIDDLGNYSDSNWFLSLKKPEIIKFLRELIDIWNYRAQLTHQTKMNIYPPYGEPFSNLSLNYIYQENNIINIRKFTLEYLEKLVYFGVDKDSKSLGAYYILGALTLVNNEAANALPWLYHSFI